MRVYRPINLITALAFGLLYASPAQSNVGSFSFKTLTEASLVFNDTPEPWLNAWLEGGVGVHRFSDAEQLTITQILAELSVDLSPNLSVEAVAQYTPDGDTKLGFNEAYLNYRPLTNKIKHQVKVGYFYPQFSLENSDLGWTSPYTQNFSAINSWVAEEIRPLGIEWQVTRPGNRYHSNWSYTGVASAYVQNDGVASLLAWRGWAIHTRQTLIGEKVHFANYFKFQPVMNPNPTYVDINDETDGRVGFYLGAHALYKRQTDIRLYFYDNQADPFAIESDMQYGWRTRFVSLSLLHKFNRNLRILGQYMSGDTEMGDRAKGVFNNFDSWYLMLSYLTKQHRYALRIDEFNVDDTDDNPFDPNSSNGSSVTLSYRYVPNKQWQLIAESTVTQSDNENRALWPNWATKHTQKALSLSAQYRF